MNRRALIALALAVALDPFTAKADLVGTRRMHRADLKCQRAGKLRERHGLTERERAYLTDRLQCQQLDGEWHTAKVFQAGD